MTNASRALTRRREVLVILGIALLAINLRPAVNSIGIVIPKIQQDLALSNIAAGVLLALPTLSFAFLGILVPKLMRASGVQFTVCMSIGLLIGGQVLRTMGPGAWALFLGSILALSGIAIGNVVMPGLVRLYFPDRIAGITALYAALILLGGAFAAGLTLPIQHALGGTWQMGIGIWIFPAALALVPWLYELIRSSRRESLRLPNADDVRLLGLLRSRRAWIMVVLFGSQAVQGYVVFGWVPAILHDAGMTDQAAATAIAITMGVGIPMSLITPMLVRRINRMRVMMWGFSVCLIAAYLGLITVPQWALWLHAPLIGIGSAIGAAIFALFALRASTPHGATILSAFSQSVGYLVASIGPIGFGVLRDLTGGWTVPLMTMILAAIAMLVSGLASLREGTIEAELTQARRESEASVLGSAISE